jgi:dolichol-phosphate mannosyltransferase
MAELGPVLVVIPTYQERENLRSVLTRLHAAVPDAEVLVVDDASPDGTGELADEMAAADPRIRVLHRPGKAGLGAAYLAGFARALEGGYQLVVEMDADGSHAPEDLPALLDAAADADLVLGSRYVPGGSTRNWGLVRRLISRGGSVYTALFLRMGVHDPTGGFKCFRRAVLERLDLDAITPRGYAFQIEMTYRAKQAGFTVVEIPITFVDREVGQSKMSRSVVLEAIWRVPLLRMSGKS